MSQLCSQQLLACFAFRLLQILSLVCGREVIKRNFPKLLPLVIKHCFFPHGMSTTFLTEKIGLNTTQLSHWILMVGSKFRFQVKADTIISVWKDGYRDELAKVTSLGYKALLHSPWYLDDIMYGPDWMVFYAVEPLDFNGR